MDTKTVSQILNALNSIINLSWIDRHLGLMARRCFPVAKIGSSNLPGVVSCH